MPNPDNKKLLKKNRITHYYVNNQHYYTLKSKKPGAIVQTLKGHMFHLLAKNKKEKIYINPSLKGKYQFFVELLIANVDKLKITLHKNNEFQILGFFKQMGRHFLKRKLTLARSDQLILEMQGAGTFILGNPVLTKYIPPKERNYIFLISVDTLRADHLSCYGYSKETSPHIDQFSKNSVLFINAYSQSPWTLPSHMSLFTSLYEFHHGVNKKRPLLPKRFFAIEELSCRFITRSFNGGALLSPRFNFFRGFDFYFSNNLDYISPHSSQNLFDRVILDIENNDFPNTFYFLHTLQVHSPYNPLPQYLNKINPYPQYNSLRFPPKEMPYADDFKMYPLKIARAAKDLYDAEIMAFDTWFGKFLRFLKDKEIYDQAMIIILSDHGEEFYEHRFWTHSHSVYNEVVKIPLIIKFPKGKFKNKRINDLVRVIDIMPTILNQYKFTYNTQDIDGEDLIPLIKGRKKERLCISSLTCGNNDTKYPFKIALIKSNSKMIFNLPYKFGIKCINPMRSKKIKFEYYDLQTDPEEQNNIYLKNMYEVKKYRNLFDNILKKAMIHIKNKKNENKQMIDTDFKKTLESLGYL